jgi:predicted CoA-substrate-specific enzyme activase
MNGGNFLRSLGLCVGASSIGHILLETDNDEIKLIKKVCIPHEGNPRHVIKEIMNSYNNDLPQKITITGRKFRNMINASSISEPEAIEYAFEFIRKTDTKLQDVNIIVSGGGETFLVYEIDKRGKIFNVYTGNKCASGTGEFFLQQLKRMDMTIEEAINCANLNKPYKVAGRCSVFCKSDCTHALNKNIDKGKVVAGLCEMMADKIIELIKKTTYKKVLLIGGTSHNKVMLHFLKEKISEIIIPQYADTFEALGAALWGIEHSTKSIDKKKDWLNLNKSSFSFLEPLYKYKDKVIFKDFPKKEAAANDKCILGLDVGSTTTKAVLIRRQDNAIIASCYLRTKGNPIKASRMCYEAIKNQINCPIEIIGLGVTGSGRQIAALHALSPGVVNEIIAHAKGALYFDSQVDTIFEIGGQDAKYTCISKGIPSDYAMNEACSAGTGSFLEEAAKESLFIDTMEIEKIALESKNPPNFNDQCAAFISSDIKNAIQEGIDVRDIVAGLVYSICMNYINKVKANREIGEKIFMQGGVCYNKAVPIAMAALTGKEIIVPPEPGLIGAFGAALYIKEKLDLNLLEPKNFDLEELSLREVTYREPFVCSGGKEKCDRKCQIQRIEIDNNIYPFGGACNKYYNLVHHNKEKNSETDFVRLREKMIFEDYSINRGFRLLPRNNQTVGINKSLLTNSFFPLYYQFFYGLGYDVLLSNELDKEGIEKKGASFCYPVEISHGALENLIKKNPDIYFIPHIKSIEVKNGFPVSVTCPFVQGEPYYLKSAFDELNKKIVLTPVLDFAKGYNSLMNTFVKMAKSLSIDAEIAKKSFEIAMKNQKDFYYKCKEIGKRILLDLEEDKDKIAFVLFGRPYNAFSQWGNMGIPSKFASRNYTMIPFEFLPFDKEEIKENMYWAMGQFILKAARMVKKHPQLYGVYITNFSCGPDSFLNGYFRTIMDKKPSLILELDNHTADAGIDTRIEAYIDIVKSYRQLDNKWNQASNSPFHPAYVEMDKGTMIVYDSNGQSCTLDDERVHVLIPSMGDMGSKLLAATFNHIGVNASALEEPGEEELKIGRGLSSCKECLPLQLTIGSLMKYLDERKNKDELLVYFMPDTSGPCRFGQYSVLIKKLISRFKIKNVAVFSLNSENGYAGFGMDFLLRGWHSVIISDVLEEIRSAILVLAKDKQKGMQIYKEVCKDIILSVRNDNWKRLKETLEASAKKLKTIETNMPIEDAVKVALVGEIYVRRDRFSRKKLVERLAKRNIIVKVAPIEEWMYYLDYIQIKRFNLNSTIKDRISTTIKRFFKNQYEKTIKQIFAKSGLYEYKIVEVNKIISNVKDLIHPALTGEAILTVGSAITEIVDEVSGVISIGPFGCMPSRIAEAVITEQINRKKILVSSNSKLIEKVMEKHPALPFLSIESDGNIFPQIIEARLETFCLQVERLHHTIQKLKNNMDDITS